VSEIAMRSAARILVMLCGLGSMACTLYAGHHNRSLLLVSMFAVWVVLPFLGFLSVLRIANRGSTQTATILQAIAMVLCAAALILYAAFALYPQGHHAAAPFLLLPVCSWAVVGAMFFYARRRL